MGVRFLIIPLVDISDKEIIIEGSDKVKNYDLNSFSSFKPLDEIKFKFCISNISEQLIIKGKISLDVRLQCSRCIEFFSTTLQVSDFLRNLSLGEDQNEVDITDEIREELVLNIKPFPVCMNDCKGICPQCGKNLNRNNCYCVNESFSNTWSVLDKLDL